MRQSPTFGSQAGNFATPAVSQSLTSSSQADLHHRPSGILPPPAVGDLIPPAVRQSCTSCSRAISNIQQSASLEPPVVSHLQHSDSLKPPAVGSLNLPAVGSLKPPAVSSLNPPAARQFFSCSSHAVWHLQQSGSLVSIVWSLALGRRFHPQWII